MKKLIKKLASKGSGSAKGREDSDRDRESEDSGRSSQIFTSVTPSTTTQSSDDDDGALPVPHDFQREPHGLFTLYPRPGAGSLQEPVKVDIVAVHGLNGSARKTWTEPQSGIFWLEDLLPQDMPEARIMTFGYDAGLAFSRCRSGIDNFARDLLNRLRLVRSGIGDPERPLVFVAHSLGGIVVKKALVIAHEESLHYGSIENSTAGIVFFGIRKNILRQLDSKSTTLMEISRQFTHRATSLKIMSLVEQRPEGPLSTVVVPEYSSVLGLNNEIILPVNVSHREICRYRHRNQNYDLLVGAVREILSSKPTSQPSQTIIQAQRRLDEIKVESSPTLINHDTRSSSRTSRISPIPASKAMPTRLKALDRSRASVARSDEEIYCPGTTSSSEANQSRPVKLYIKGLRRKLSARTYGQPTFALTVLVQSDISISKIAEKVIEEHPDLRAWEHFRHPGEDSGISETWQDVFTVPVQVVSGPSVNSLAAGLKINKGQTIAAFFSRMFPNPVEVILSGQRDSPEGISSQTSSEEILIQRNGTRSVDPQTGATAGQLI